MSFTISTDAGDIRLAVRPDAAPVTVEHMKNLITKGLFDNTCYYRSDFVIQCGFQDVEGKSTGGGDEAVLPVNETKTGVRISNTRGTCAVAHWDVPDNGCSEWFINLQENAHLDEAYGGYCVWASVSEGMEVVDAIAAAVAGGQKVKISTMRWEE